MKSLITKTLAATILTIAISAHAAVRSHAGTIIVESPSDLPELAQTPATAMYLHETGAGQAILYLEQNNGRRLAILDVTDPAAIKAVSQTTVDAKAPFDFIRDLGDSAILIRYRDQSGLAILNVRRYRHPAISAAPQLTDAAVYERLGETALLLEPADAPVQPAAFSARYNVVDLSAPAGPALLTTVNNITQRLARPETGTLFLLTSNGLTVVRRTHVEQEYRNDQIQMDHN